MKVAQYLLLAGLTVSPALAQRDFSDVTIETTEIKDGIYMLQGAGGNIGISSGEDGVFMIDDQFQPLSEKIRDAIREISDGEIKYLINTHYHGDHTGGNSAFANDGAVIVAHDNVRARLSSGAEVPANSLPVITFSDTTTFYMNGNEVHIFHPEMAHTDGDSIIIFKTSNVVHTGDLFFAGRYPYIDIDSGGSLNGYIAALEALNGMIDADTVIIPGHGPISSQTEIAASIDMLVDVRARIQALIEDGLSLEETVAADPLADLNDTWSWGFINGDRFTESAYRSLTQ